MTTPFGHPTLVVASRHEPLKEALSKFINLFLGENLVHNFPDDYALTIRCVEELHTCLNSFDRAELFDTVCVVDLAGDSSGRWDITANESGFRPSELALRYPGVYFIFLVDDLPLALQKCKKLLDVHFVCIDQLAGLIPLLQRHAYGFRAWFDPVGLRSWVRGGALPSQYGAAVDDEASFAVLNGYVLYRNHRSTYVIVSHFEMKKVLGVTREKGAPQDRWVVMDDLELNFGDTTPDDRAKGYLTTDKTDNGRFSPQEVMERRNKEFPVLEQADSRFLVTATTVKLDFSSPKDQLVIKPYGGMFARELKALRVSSCNDAHCPDDQSVDYDGGYGHRVADVHAQIVAEALLERARRIANDADSPESAIHGALLAHDARQLLHGKSLALSLEALAIQQRMEVTAECAFIGTTSKLVVKERFSELKQLIEAIVVSKKSRSHQIYNALVEIADDIRQIYQRYDQFEEEEEAIRKLRIYEWRLKYWATQPPSQGFIRTLARIILKLVPAGMVEGYFIYVVSSLWRLGICMVLWIVVFACWYNYLDYTGSLGCNSFVFYDWLIHSALSFFAPGEGILGDPKIANMNDIFAQDMKGFHEFRYIAGLEAVFGFVHLGIFISYLFQKISRR